MSDTINNSSAYTILVNEDNTMTTTQKRRIVQRSKLVDDLWFLVPQMYNGYNMAVFTVLLEYVLPVSKRYQSDILVLSDSTYNGFLKYHLPVDTVITDEAGDIDLMLTFLYVDIDEYGNTVQRVRKVVGHKICVCPISAWSDIIPDSALTALDQRIIKTDAQIKALSDLNNAIYQTKADNISYDESTRELQLTSSGKKIGNKVVISASITDLEDGLPAVDFGHIEDNPIDPSEPGNDVVVF